MTSGWRYRVAAVAGTAFLAAAAVLVASAPAVERVVRWIPLLERLPVGPESPGRLWIETATTLVVVLVAAAPLYKPRPRRILDTITLSQKRVALAVLALATVGYFDFSFRVPRLTLIVSSTLLFALVPAWFLLIRRSPRADGGRAVIVGDDPATIADILEATDRTVVGYVSPPSAYYGGDEPASEHYAYADGGAMSRLDDLPCLGGLSRLDEVLVDHDVDTAALAFARPDRAEFFGTLDTCYDHGVTAMIHRDHADLVLTRGMMEGDLVEIDLEPWDWQDHLVKRMFDVAFAAAALVVAAPLVAAIAAAIKLDDGGPVLYSQERTAAFGDTFTVYKFRSMVVDAEREGARLSEEDNGGVDPRVTRAGRFIRATHFDEIPQLWSILVGRMSVVGPRPERPEFDEDMNRYAERWRNRWFVKPGLTGLAQINGATGHDPEEKLRYDITYIRDQTFWYDVKIVVRQLWLVIADMLSAVADRGRAEE